MRVVTAPPTYRPQPAEVVVFLAGGVSDCLPWDDQAKAQG